jgi:serine protease
MKRYLLFHTMLCIMLLLVFNEASISRLSDNKILITDKKLAILSNTALVRFKKGIIQKSEFKILNSELNKGFVIDHPMLQSEQSITFNKESKVFNSIQSSKMNKIMRAEEPLLRTYVIQFPGDENPIDFCRKLKKENPDIEIAEPYYLPEVLSVPNDPYASQQEMLNVIKGFQAWDFFQGDTNVVIGISDSGLLQEHEDLANSIAPNWEDPINDFDDDGNGYIDDFRGYNVTYKEENGKPYNTFHPLSGHGTEVGGIAGATYNNGIGMTGTAGKCRIFPIKAGLSIDSRYIIAGYESIMYAAVRGFKVLNCSWGSAKEYSDLEQSIVDYAVARDVAIVAAAGNNYNSTEPYYPANYLGVLGVGEVDIYDKLTSSSSIGSHVRIMAPGGGNWYTTNVGGYDNGGAGGTSFASPVVAGFVAFIRAKYPYLEAMQSLEFARQCVDNIGLDNEMFISIIPGRVNMLKAVQTDPYSIPGIKPVSFELVSSSGVRSERFALGDTVTLNIQAHNYLGNAKNLQFVFSGVEDYSQTIKVIDSIKNIEEVNTGQDISINGFRFIVNDINRDRIFFRIDIKDPNEYHDFFLLPFTSGAEVTTFSNDVIKFSVGDRGTIGFAGADQNIQGIGFVLKGYSNQLFKGGLLASESETFLISANNGMGENDNDFDVLKTYIPPDKFTGIVNDNKALSTEKIGVEIKQEFIVPQSWRTVAKILVTVKNVSGRTLNDFAIGYYMDWDVGDDENNNKVIYYPNAKPDGFTGVAAAEYVQRGLTGTGYPIFGSAVYSEDPGALPQAAGLSIDTTQQFSKQRQINALNSGIKIQYNQINDVSYVIGMKFPGEFKNGDEHHFSMSFGCGYDTTVLFNRWRESIYPTYSSVENSFNSTEFKFVISPQPASDNISIMGFNPHNGSLEIIVYNLMGEQVLTSKNINTENGFINTTLDTRNLNSGMYLVRIMNGKNVFSKPVMIVK